MNKVAIIYASHDGHTQKIAKTLHGNLEQAGINADCLSVAHCNAHTAHNYEVLIFGAAIRHGKHLKPMIEYLQAYSELLAEKKTAFFSVSLTARKVHRDTAETNNYVKKMLKRLSWKPDEVDVFAGKLNYPHYHFCDRNIIRFIMWITDGPTDVNSVHEFTDWSRVKAFSQRLIVLINR